MWSSHPGDHAMTNTIARHREYTSRALEAINKFGYLRNIDLGWLLYPEAKTRDRLAAKLTQGMARDGLLLAAKGEDQTFHYGLSLKGARALGRATGGNVRTGKDIIRNVSSHRNACNEVAITLLSRYKDKGMDCVTERETATSERYTLGEGRLRKIPDCVSVHRTGKLRVWLEIENSRRSQRDVNKLARWVYHVAFPNHTEIGYQDYLGGKLVGLVLVPTCREAETIRARLLAAISAISAEANDFVTQHERLIVQERIGYANITASAGA